MSKTVAIIGSGIVGVSTALWLLRDGHKVVLIDRLGAGEGTSYGNGGVLASCAMVPVTGPGLIKKAPKMALDPNQPLFLKWGYLPKLAPWLFKYLKHANADDTVRISKAVKEIVGDSLEDHLALARGTRAEKWIVPSDYMFLYNDRQHFEGDAFVWSIRESHGFTWEELGPDALKTYDPVFADQFKLAIKLPNHGRIADPGQYTKDLALEAEALGARILKADVEDIVQDNGSVTGVRAGGETIACDAAVIATGVWSGPLCKKLGLKVPLESERGYHVEFYEPNFMPKGPVMVASGKFVVTPMDGRLRAAGVVEFGGLDAPPSKAPFDLLMKNMKSAFPGLSWKYTKEWMGHRPAPADSIPVIGEIPGIKGAFTGFGHHHIGLTGGPKTGRLLAQMIADKQPNLDVRVYSPARYAS